MKTQNLNDLKNLNIIELTKEEQRKIMGGNGSSNEEDYNYGIDIDFTTGIAIGGALVAQKLGKKAAKASDTAASFM